jgi:acyl CoA:acetate/3-ketoacid CoA transferase beta subunit
VIVTTTHTTRSGAPKILNHCTLPLTAKSCVNTIITELAVIEVAAEGLLLREVAAESDVKQVLAKTDAPLIIPEGALPVF